MDTLATRVNKNLRSNENYETVMKQIMLSSSQQNATLTPWILESLKEPAWFSSNLPAPELLNKVQPEFVYPSIIDNEYSTEHAKAILAGNLAAISMFHNITGFAPHGRTDAVEWLLSIFNNGIISKTDKQNLNDMEHSILVGLGSVLGYHREALINGINKQIAENTPKEERSLSAMTIDKEETDTLYQVLNVTLDNLIVDFDTFVDSTSLLMAIHDNIARIDITDLFILQPNINLTRVGTMRKNFLLKKRAKLDF